MSDRMNELLMAMQRRFESSLEEALPQQTTPYFDRGSLVGKLLLAAHEFNLQASQILIEKTFQLTYGMPQIVLGAEDCKGLLHVTEMEKCPTCRGECKVPDRESLTGTRICPECKGLGLKRVG